MTGCPLLDSEYAARQNGKRLPCERLQAENAKLREQIHWLKKGDILHVLTDQEFAEQQKHEREMQASIKALDDENAKLRELARDMHKALFSLNLDHCQACPRDSINGPCTKFMVCGSDECSIEKDMRELGVDA